MKSFAFEFSLKNLFENYEVEPSFNIQSLDKKSPDDLFDFQHDLCSPNLFPSFDFHGDFEDEENGWIKMDNWLMENKNDSKLVNTAAISTDAIKNEDLLSNEMIKDQVSNIEQAKSENLNSFSQDKSQNIIDEDGKSESMSDDDSEYKIDGDDNVGMQIEQKKSLKKDTQRRKVTRNSKQKRQQGVILERWNRETDKDVFQFLRDSLKTKHMDIEEFIFDTSVKITNDKEETILWEMRREMLELAIHKFGWINTPYFLFKRLRKLASNQSFSFRETKQLKKIHWILSLQILNISSMLEQIYFDNLKIMCNIKINKMNNIIVFDVVYPQNDQYFPKFVKGD